MARTRLTFATARPVLRLLKLSYLFPAPMGRSFLLAMTLGLVAGCDSSDEAISAYRAPKEPPPQNAGRQAGATTAPPGLHWKAPSGWEEQPASGFRKGSFLIRGQDGQTADVSIISFPEEAGGLLGNVNRWREQLKLAPVATEADAGAPFRVSAGEVFFVDIVSEQPLASDSTKSRILGGIFPVPGETWFFKMLGPDELVASQRDTFKQFLESVHAAQDGHAHGPADAGQSTNAPTAHAPETTAPPPPRYTLPPGWEEKPLTPMRVASFKASAANGKEIDISVVFLAGAAGGDLANVNRWRDQVKLPPINEAALQESVEHIIADGHDFLVVDLVSPEPIGEQKEKQRIIAAILDEQGSSWFIKMTGEDAAVASQKNALADFLRSLKLH